MSTLYKLTSEYMELLALAEDPDIDPQVFEDTLEGLEGELEVKADGYACVIAELSAEKQKFKAEIDRLTAHVRCLDNNIERMKDSLMFSMHVTGKTKFKTDHFRFGIARNGGIQPMHVDDVDKIPEEYLIREPKPDNEKIRKALNDGAKLDFAYLKPRGEHLNIR